MEPAEQLTNWQSGMTDEYHRTLEENDKMSNALDLYRDEFMRIKVLVDVDEENFKGKFSLQEIKGLCERAISDIKTFVPLIQQLETEQKGHQDTRKRIFAAEEVLRELISHPMRSGHSEVLAAKAIRALGMEPYPELKASHDALPRDENGIRILPYDPKENWRF